MYACNDPLQAADGGRVFAGPAGLYGDARGAVGAELEEAPGLVGPYPRELGLGRGGSARAPHPYSSFSEAAWQHALGRRQGPGTARPGQAREPRSGGGGRGLEYRTPQPGCRALRSSTCGRRHVMSPRNWASGVERPENTDASEAGKAASRKSSLLGVRILGTARSHLQLHRVPRHLDRTHGGSSPAPGSRPRASPRILPGRTLNAGGREGAGRPTPPPVTQATASAANQAPRSRSCDAATQSA